MILLSDFADHRPQVRIKYSDSKTFSNTETNRFFFYFLLDFLAMGFVTLQTLQLVVVQ